MLKLQKDHRAEIIGLPLELIIIAVVVMISLPLIYSYFNIYVKKQVESDLNRELDDLIQTIRDVDNAEYGNRRSFSLDFEDHPFFRLSYIEFGGEEEHMRGTLRYKFRHEQEVIKSLEGIEVSAQKDGEFVEASIPLDGTSIFLERCPSMDFIRITWGDQYP